MKISVNWISYYQQLNKWSDDPVPNGIDDLLARIGAQLGGIEEVVRTGQKYDGVLIVKVVSCEDHPNADRLHICMIDDGGKAQNVPRDENGLVQVVCGAPNVRAGVTVAWLPPGVTVPSTYGVDPFVLEARELRGVVSNGMLASPKELAIGDSHEGLLLIEEDVEPGTLFGEKYGLTDDVIIDIENKMFTHRPDCFGWLGLAREIAGIQHMPFTSPEWYNREATIEVPESASLKLEVRNEIPDLVLRFTAVTMSDITVGPSPVWMQIELARVGLRPINNIVDFTNYYMLLTGQPLHAYDYDKVMAQDPGADHATLVIRKPHEGEKLLLLNGKEIEPRPDAIMIASATRAIGLGGVMGGGDTEVDVDTRNIILECASFDMYSIRRTSMHSGIFSDAVTRFNKGQSPLQNMAVLAKIVGSINRRLGGTVAGHVIDDNHLPQDVRERGSLYPDVVVSAGFINERLGLKLSVDEMAALLKNVEFAVDVANDSLTVRAPFWRTDIEIPEDVVEEVGRLYGFDKLPLELPKRTITPARKDQLLALKSSLRTTLSSAGANEVLGYSFVHGNLLDKVGQNKAEAFRLSNALSPDLQYYRLSLTPGLLEKVHPNIKAGYGTFALFEAGKTHNKKENDSEGLPREVNNLALVFAADSKSASAFAGSPYYQARKYLMRLMAVHGSIGMVAFEPLAGADLYKNPWVEQMTAPYEPKRSAVLRDREGLIWGVVGEYKTAVKKALKLPDFAAGFECDPLLFLHTADTVDYVPLPRFPKVEQDICLRVPADTTYYQVHDFVRTELAKVQPDNTLPSLSPVDIYRRDDDQAYKQITLRYSIASYDRTMTDAEVAGMLDTVAAAAKEQLAAERI